MLGTVGAGMAAAVVHNVMVGASDHKFKPDSVMADVGDIICEFFFLSFFLRVSSIAYKIQLLIWRGETAFQFYPTNHSVVRMDPAWPCKPYELVNPKDPHGGWWSGFRDVATFMDPV